MARLFELMRTNLRAVVLVFGAAVVATGAFAALHAKPSAADSALAKYAAARCVPPHAEQETRTWNDELELPTGLKINVSASGFVGGLVFVRYPDGAVRHVTMLRDYVYPHDIRLTADAKTLWILNSGLAGGIRSVADLYEYDISSRMVHDLSVEPEDLPEPCPVTTARTFTQPPTTK